MINRDIIDTDKKTPAENLGQLVKSTCIGFTVAMIAFLALGTCFADDTAKQGINYGSVRPGLTYMCPHGAISLTP